MSRCPHGYVFALYGDPYPANCAVDGCESPLLAERKDAARLRGEYVRALRKLPRTERDLHARLTLQEAMADSAPVGGNHG